MTLLAIIIAFALFHWVEKPKWLLSFDFLKSVNRFLLKEIKLDVTWSRYLVMIILPLLMLWFLVEWLEVQSPHPHSACFLLVHVFVLYLCLGPKAMDSDLADNVLLKELKLGSNSEHETIIRAMTDAALHRWFGVFFWYLFFGLWGALVYRIGERIHVLFDTDQSMCYLASRLLSVMQFPVIIVMSLSLAVATDFEKVWKKCKLFLNWQTIQELRGQYLYDAMYDYIEYEELESKEETTMQVMRTTLSVLKRMLVVWLVFVALLVLFSVR